MFTACTALTLSPWVSAESVGSTSQAELVSEVSSACQAHNSVEHTTNPLDTGDDPSIANRQQEVVIESDYAEVYEDGRMRLEGDVEIAHPEYSAQSDLATLNQLTGDAALEGDVRLESPFMILDGKTAQVQLDTNQAQVTEVSFQHRGSNLRGEAKELKQSSREQAAIIDGMVTTCSPDDRVWSIHASEIELDQEAGFGEAYHTRFEVYDVPVLYIPWFSFPIDDRRKTGFLYPTIGSSNAAGGLFVSTPYYWNIAPEADLTYTPSAINGRGLHHEMETRYLSKVAITELGLGYIDQDEDFDDEFGEPSRWAIQFNQEWDFAPYNGSAWTGSVNFGNVSDEDYLEDLNQGLQIGNQTELDRRAFFQYTADDWKFDIQLQHYENIEDDVQPQDEAFQRLPEINFLGYQSLSHLDLTWQSQYVYFYRDPDDLSGIDRTHGSRFRHRPKLSWPLRNSWGYLTPSIEVDHTDYYLRENTIRDNHVARTVAFGELDTGLYLDRQVRYFGSDMRHSLEPRLYYVYSEFEDQSQLPNFDVALPSFAFERLFESHRFSGGDRVGDNNRATLGLTNRWVDAETSLERLVLGIAYLKHIDRPRLGLSDEQSEGRSVGVNSIRGQEGDDAYWAATVSTAFSQDLTFLWTSLWDSSLAETEESFVQLSAQPADDWRVSLSHRYRNDDIEQSDLRVAMPISDQVKSIASWRYDLQDNRTIGSLMGLEYQSCCWRAQLLAQSYLTDESEIDHGILLRFELLGFNPGSASSNFEETLFDE